MSDIEALLSVLAALYAVECILWVPRGTVAVYSRFGRHCRIARPEELFGNQRGGLLLLSPLPGVGRAFLCREPIPETAGVLDLNVLRSRLAALDRHARPAESVGLGLLLLLVVVVPLAVWRFGWTAAALPLAGLLVAGEATAVVMFLRGHRRLYPDAASTRRSRALVIALSPLAAMRAGDELARNLLHGVDPLAAALVLCDPATSTALARRRLWDAGCRDASFARAGGALANPLLEALRQAGIPLELVLAPPPPDSPAARAYCPRCHSQHVRIEGGCDACPGVTLVTYDQTRSNAVVD